MDYHTEPTTDGGIEITFADVPPEEVRATISCMGMRYNRNRRLWYGKGITKPDLDKAVEDALAGRKGRFAPGDGTEYAITPNKEYNSIEVRFNGKPSEAVRRAVRGLGMRWHRLKCCWYSSYVDATEVENVIKKAMHA